MTDDQRDPVEDALGDRYDLYDVATWDVRSRLDVFAVRLTAALRTARTWLLVVTAGVLFLAQLAIGGLLVVEQPILGGLALVSIVPALALTGYFWYGDPTRREPVELLAITFLLSLLFASFAAIVNSLFAPAFELFGIVGLALFFFVVVAPVEETVKWLAVRVHAYKTDSFDTVVDGVVYGAVAGLGFAAIENLVYILNIYLTTAEAGIATPLAPAVDVAYLRAFVGPGHVIYSAFAGYYLGLAKFNPENRGPIVVKGLVIAAFIHATYNSLVTVLPLTQMGFVAFVVVYDGLWLLVLYRKIARYRSLYEEARTSGPGRTGGPETAPPRSEFESETDDGREAERDEAPPERPRRDWESGPSVEERTGEEGREGR
ncbi:MULTISPECIES: PrsW family intramembrane metalloprotease [Salinibaculum]|uniref:PrsW family intramembrane metalloprotease n=1 Tax=Salinibaculum TaxID=2732368 RepID=UPI0030CB7214